MNWEQIGDILADRNDMLGSRMGADVGGEEDTNVRFPAPREGNEAETEIEKGRRAMSAAKCWQTISQKTKTRRLGAMHALDLVSDNSGHMPKAPPLMGRARSAQAPRAMLTLVWVNPHG